MKQASLTRRQLKDFARLSQRRYRDDTGLCLVEGIRSVTSAVDAGAPLKAILASPEASREVRDLLERAAAPVHVLSADDLRRVGDTRTSQGLLAVAAIERSSAEGLEPPLIVLDAVQNPGNVGAVLRSAAWFGVKGVLVGPGTADPFGPKALRASMGGIWDVRVAEALDLVAALGSMTARGVQLYGADLEGTPVAEWRPGRHSGLVIGSEARGLSEELGPLLAGRVRIDGAPGRRGVESLNAAVAAGIILHAWLG